VRSDNKPVFAIFEGGGAKGIAHVGAYAAANDLKFEFIGVAGASAGAIVAALIAVGFKPNEIFNPENREENIFSSHGITPMQAIGASAWREFEHLRRYWLNIWIVLIALFAGALAFRFVGWTLAARTLGILLIATLAASLARAWSFLIKKGIFDPSHFAEVFNELLHARVLAMYAEADKPIDQIPAKIRFRDIDPQVVSLFCRLKIVATDISGQQLRLFDHRTPDVVVAEAVAASIAIPGLFKPATIPSVADGLTAARARHYADGGLVSNLPVWCFSEEKAAAERRQPNSKTVPIVGFALSEAEATDPPGATLPSFRYFRQVIQSAIFGGQTVVQEFVPDLFAIQLPSDLGVLAFDATWDQAKAAYDKAKHEAASRLRQRLVVEPQEWSRVLLTASQKIREIIVAEDPVLATVELKWRAAVFEPSRGTSKYITDTFVTAYKVTRSHNMESDTDDRLTLDAECPGVPQAFRQRAAVLWSPVATTAQESVMTKYERALVRRSVKCAICIPIFSAAEQWNLPSASRNQPLAVVAFDTDVDIIGRLQEKATTLNAIIESTVGIGALLTELGR
jgi:NTE family protein